MDRHRGWTEGQFAVQARTDFTPHRLALAGAPPCPPQGTSHEIVSERCFTASASSLVNEWSEFARSAGAPPQRQPGWTRAWWNAFGTGALEIHTIREDGRLAGVLPMIRQGGVLKAAANIHTPGFGVLANSSPPVADELAQALFADEPQRISLIDLAPGSQVQNLL